MPYPAQSRGFNHLQLNRRRNPHLPRLTWLTLILAGCNGNTFIERSADDGTRPTVAQETRPGPGPASAAGAPERKDAHAPPTPPDHQAPDAGWDASAPSEPKAFSSDNNGGTKRDASTGGVGIPAGRDASAWGSEHAELEPDARANEEQEGQPPTALTPAKDAAPEEKDAAPGAQPDAGSTPEPAPVDECPRDPQRIRRGSCGCEFPLSHDCNPLAEGLVHRYAFDGTGAVVADSVGDAHGITMGSTLKGDGTLPLSGKGDYVELPSGLLAGLSNASFESWLVWHGESAWGRIFDFGNLAGSPLAPDTTLYLTTENTTSSQRRGISSRLSYDNTSKGFAVTTGTPMPVGVLAQTVLVADATKRLMSLYLDGEKIAEEEMSAPLSEVNDSLSRLGRSLYEDDDDLDGIYYEFRVYDVALTPAQVSVSYHLGPDTPYKTQP